MPDWELYQEAYKRRILPADKKELYEEALRRGLVPKAILTTEELFGEKAPGRIVTSEELFGKPNPDDIVWDKPDPNQIVWDQPPKPSLLKSVGQTISPAIETLQNVGKVYPAVETGLNLLTSMYGVPASGLAMLAGLPFGKEQQWGEAVEKATVYQPQTQAGQQLTGAVSYPFQKLGEVSEKAADISYELTGSPLVATAIGTGIQASPLLLGMRSGKGKAPTEMLAAKKQLVKEGYPVTKGTAIERWTEKFPPGSWFYEKWQKRLNEMVKKSNDQFVTEKLNLPDPAMIDEFKGTADTAWKDMRDLMGKDTTVESPNLIQWIKDNPSEMNALKVSKDKSLFSFLTRIDKESQRGGVVFADLNKINENVWSQSFGKLSPNERRVRWEVQKALKGDIENIQNTTGVPIWDAYNSAMEKSTIVHRAEAGNFVENLFKRATVLDRDKGVTIFYPEMFKKQVEANQGRLQTFFKKEPEILGTINDYSDMMLGAASDLLKYKAQKPTSFLERMAGFGGGVGLGIYGGKWAMENPLAATAFVVPAGFEIMMSRSLANPRGWMKKFLFRESHPLRATREMMRPMAVGTVLGPQRQFEEEYGFPAQ